MTLEIEKTARVREKNIEFPMRFEFQRNNVYI